MINESPPSHNAAGAAFTDLILETFRLNGALLAAGDGLAAPFGLSSARWQVLGAIATESLPVAHIARRMGLQRQSVQRLADILAAEGFVDYADNPNHRRAKLVRLTDRGHHSLKALHIRQAEWANHLAAGLNVEALHAAGLILSTLRQRLDAEEEALS